MYEKAKWLKYAKLYSKFFLELWNINKLMKNVFSQPLPCKKIAVKFDIFFFNK